LLPPHDIWLSAIEALGLNVCDHISELTRWFDYHMSGSSNT
jgi:hypothetical protein